MTPTIKPNTAIKRAKKQHQEYLEDGVTSFTDMNPCTTVYKLVKRLQKLRLE